ncbi:MAG: hypothetical protein ACHQVS_04930 [Candidatus Babeliales bacterium]
MNNFTSFFKKYSLYSLIIAVLLINIPMYPMEPSASTSSRWQTAKTVGKVAAGIVGITALYIATCIGYTAWYRHGIQVKKRTEDKRVLPKPAQPKPWAAVEERYRKELEEEGEQILHKLLTVVRGTKEQFLTETATVIAGKHPNSNYAINLEREIKKVREGEFTPVSHDIKETIATLLQQQEVDPATVCIVRDDNYDSSMGVCGGVLSGKARLIVNEKVLTHSSQRYLEWVVLHEIQHMKHEDSIVVGMNKANEKVSVILHEDRLFREKRADILASLNSLEHAKASLEYFFVPRFTVPAVWAEIKLKRIRYDEHPDHITRSLYLAKVHHEMHACVEQHKKRELAEAGTAH